MIKLTAAAAWRCARPSTDTDGPLICPDTYCASRWAPDRRIPSSYQNANDSNSRVSVVFWGSAANRSSHPPGWDATVRRRWYAVAGQGSRPASAPGAGHICRDSSSDYASLLELSAPSRWLWLPVKTEEQYLSCESLTVLLFVRLNSINDTILHSMLKCIRLYKHYTKTDWSWFLV